MHSHAHPHPPAQPHAPDHAGHNHADHGHAAHGGGHHHGPPPGAPGRAFGLAIGLNTAFVVVEFAFGWVANSTALMADAGHNLSDVLGLVLAWGALRLARSAPTTRYTYGLRSSSILAALANAMLLLLASGAIAWEAVQRLLGTPLSVASSTVMLVAAVGIGINGFSAWLFMQGRKNDINLRGAYLHMAADAAVSLGVVVSAAAMWLTGWYWLDPLISLVIVLVVVAGTWGLLRESIQLALKAVPQHIDLSAVHNYLQQCAHVTAVHDLHVWAMSTTETALTVHLVMPQGYPGDAAMDTIASGLKQGFGIQHCTLQMEQGTTEHRCMLGE